MTHDELTDLYELYVLDVLEAEVAAEIDDHVNSRCEFCLEHLANASVVAASMAGSAELQKPPSRLRKRVISAVKPENSSKGWTWAIAALSAACAALLTLSIWSASSVQEYRSQIASLSAERTQLREAVEILSRSETRTVQFGKAENVPHGRVFVNRNRGLVVVGSQLPQLAANRTFQLWLIPTAGAPQSAGLFRPNAAGNFVQVRTNPVNTNLIHAVAVSVEPQGGSAAPTTTPVLVVPLG